jgi:nucleotide-binding universal stress UspA family protein
MQNKILCPTRGGAASYPNQDFAIGMAKERGQGLIFLYVSTVEFLGQTAYPVLIDIEEELDEMGEFLLAMAQERAEKAGVHADVLVERGMLRQVLKDVIREHAITSVVLGSSSAGSGFTTEEYTRALGREICHETGTEFIIVHEGQVVDTFCPMDNETEGKGEGGNDASEA